MSEVQKAVPEGWEAISLGEVASVSSGSTPARNDETFWNGDIPWITTGEINYQDIYVSDETVTQKALDLTALRLFPAGGIVMAMYGQGATRGRVARLKIDAAMNQACAYIKPGGNTDSNFLYHLFCSNYEIFRDFGHGGNQKNLSGQLIKSFPILLPPLPEQIKIASILSEWDDSLSTLTRLIEAKRQQKRGLAEQLLTGRRRLPGFEGEWEEKRLGEIANVEMGSSPSSSAYNDAYEGLPLIQGNADIKRRLAVPRVYTSEITRTCEADDIILSVRAPVGTVAKTLAKACIGRGVAAIRSYGSQEFLYQLLESQENAWGSLMQGSTFESVTGKEVKGFPIRIPPLPEQIAIASVLSTLDAEISSLEALKSSIQKQKRGLMDVLLTGRVRVNTND